MNRQQYSHNKRIIGDYIVSYGIIQSEYKSCDSVDFFKINETKYGFYLADVAGVEDASVELMHKLQELINNHCCVFAEDENNRKNIDLLDPSEVVKNINKHLYEAKCNKYVTLIYGVLDLHNDSLNYTIAGYYPNPILVDEGLEASYLFGKGYPLGLIKNTTFTKFNILLKPENSLIFFSDGILRFLMSDLKNSFSKDEQLLALVSKNPVDIDSILHKLTLTYSNPIIDDIVVLIIKKVDKK